MKPTLLLDVDGVIADFPQHYRNLAQSICDRTLPALSECRVWRMSEALGLSERETKRVDMMLQRPQTAYELEPMAGAVPSVRALTKCADVYFVTSPIELSPTWCYDRTNWLVRQFGAEIGERVVHTYYKYLVHGDVFVDDKVSNVAAWQARWKDKAGVAWAAPFNENDPLLDVHGIRRTGDWDDVFSLLVEAAGEKR